MKRIHVTIAALAALALAATVIAASAQGAALAKRPLKGTVGPGFTITLKKRSGDKVRKLKVGKYTFKISDKSSLHNFHLKGPGVNKKTGVSFVGSKTWKLKLTKGRYTYRCDPHKTIMHGRFRVVS